MGDNGLKNMHADIDIAEPQLSLVCAISNFHLF